VVQREIVSLKHSSPYTRDLFERFVKESGHNVGLITSSSQDSADSFYYYQQALLDAGATKVHWVPLDEALRKAKSAKDCEKLDQYLWNSVGEFDTARRYPELHQ